MLRASVAAECAGVPSVSLVCEGFERQALATGRGLGFDAMRLAVLRGHVDAQSADEILDGLRRFTFDEIVNGLTSPLQVGIETANPEPASLDIVVTGSIDEINEAFGRQGWSDGLPVVPPTQARVQAFLAESGHDPWRVLATARPSGRDVTVWSVAVNAVLSGCLPEHLPILLALTDVLTDPNYGVEHSGNTTGADALIILNGAIGAELGFNHGPGALRDGVSTANTRIGRWLRLFLRNVFGFIADEHDKATFGNSSRVVLAEDEDALREIGWSSVAMDFGHTRADDVVTVARMNSGLIVGSVFGSNPREIVPYLADGLARVSGWDLTHIYGLGRGQYQPLLVLSPLLARTFSRAGWTKDDLRRALYETARIPAWRFEKLIGEWSNLTAGHRTLADLVSEGLVSADFAESDDPNRLVPIVTGAEKFVIAVAGDPHRANAYVMSNDGPHGYWTSKQIDRTFSDDLVCAVPSVSSGSSTSANM